MNEKIFNGQTVLAESLLLDSLTIADGAVLTAPAGKCLTLTVNGVTRELEPGTYTGNVALTVSDAVQVDYENHGRVDHFEMANAVVISNGKYLPEKSVSAAVCAGTVSDTSVDGLTIDSRSDNFGGVYVDGDSVVTINDATMNLVGNGGNDFVGHGAGITAAGKSKVTVNRAKIHTVGSIRVTVVGREEATLEVNDSELFVKDGTKPNNVSGMTKVPWMLGLTGRVRATNLVDSATATYNRCHIKCENWGCMSTDATKVARLYLNDCTLESENCGYGAYSIGDCLDQFTRCTLNMGNYPVIMCMEKADIKDRQRLIDFVSGVVMARDGMIAKIHPNVYLCTPKNIGVIEE